MKKLLVTGANGLLGKSLCRTAQKNKDYSVFGMYKDNKPTLQDLTFSCDICDKHLLDSAFRRISPDVVIHTAALTDVDKCELDKKSCWDVNAIGTKNVAEVCKAIDTHLVYISTDFVFDGEKDSRYKEDDKPHPINCYGASKFFGEKVVSSLERSSIIRTSGIFGKRSSRGKQNFPLWVLESIRKKEQISVIHDQFYCPTFVQNLSDMTLEIVDRKMFGIFHCSGKTKTSRYEFAKLVAGSYDLDESYIVPKSFSEISFVAKRPKNTGLSTEKIWTMLKTKPLELQKAVGLFMEEDLCD